MRLAAVLALVPVLAAATPYDGTYRQNANAECALVGVDGGALKIEDGIFYGVEMECRMTRPVKSSIWMPRFIQCAVLVMIKSVPNGLWR
jgi:hypothetical protein